MSTDVACACCPCCKRAYFNKRRDDTPMRLACDHTVCYKCLVMAWNTSKYVENHLVECPVCARPTQFTQCRVDVACLTLAPQLHHQNLPERPHGKLISDVKDSRKPFSVTKEKQSPTDLRQANTNYIKKQTKDTIPYTTYEQAVKTSLEYTSRANPRQEAFTDNDTICTKISSTTSAKSISLYGLANTQNGHGDVKGLINCTEEQKTTRKSTKHASVKKRWWAQRSKNVRKHETVSNSLLPDYTGRIVKSNPCEAEWEETQHASSSESDSSLSMKSSDQGDNFRKDCPCMFCSDEPPSHLTIDSHRRITKSNSNPACDQSMFYIEQTVRGAQTRNERQVMNEAMCMGRELVLLGNSTHQFINSELVAANDTATLWHLFHSFKQTIHNTLKILTTLTASRTSLITNEYVVSPSYLRSIIRSSITYVTVFARQIRHYVGYCQGRPNLFVTATLQPSYGNSSPKSLSVKPLRTSTPRRSGKCRGRGHGRTGQPHITKRCTGHFDATETSLAKRPRLDIPDASILPDSPSFCLTGGNETDDSFNAFSPAVIRESEGTQENYKGDSFHRAHVKETKSDSVIGGDSPVHRQHLADDKNTPTSDDDYKCKSNSEADEELCHGIDHLDIKILKQSSPVKENLPEEGEEISYVISEADNKNCDVNIVDHEEELPYDNDYVTENTNDCQTKETCLLDSYTTDLQQNGIDTAINSITVPILERLQMDLSERGASVTEYVSCIPGKVDKMSQTVVYSDTDADYCMDIDLLPSTHSTPTVSTPMKAKLTRALQLRGTPSTPKPTPTTMESLKALHDTGNLFFKEKTANKYTQTKLSYVRNRQRYLQSLAGKITQTVHYLTRDLGKSIPETLEEPDKMFLSQNNWQQQVRRHQQHEHECHQQLELQKQQQQQHHYLQQKHVEAHAIVENTAGQFCNFDSNSTTPYKSPVVTSCENSPVFHIDIQEKQLAFSTDCVASRKRQCSELDAYDGEQPRYSTLPSKRKPGVRRKLGFQNKMKESPDDNKPSTSVEEVMPTPKARGFRYTQECRQIVNAVHNHVQADIFRFPIKRDQLPDYYSIVKFPISLQEIAYKLTNRHYASLREFVSNMKRMFNNMRHYCTVSKYWNDIEACSNVEKYFEWTLKDTFPNEDFSYVTGSPPAPLQGSNQTTTRSPERKVKIPREIRNLLG